MSDSCHARQTQGRDCFGAVEWDWRVTKRWVKDFLYSLTKLHIVLGVGDKIAQANFAIGQAHGQNEFAVASERWRHAANVLVAGLGRQQNGCCRARDVQVYV